MRRRTIFQQIEWSIRTQRKAQEKHKAHIGKPKLKTCYYCRVEALREKEIKPEPNEA